MQSQVFILIGAAAIMFVVIGGLSLLAHYYTLNGIKSRTVGEGQHGTARFSTKQEIKKNYRHISFQPELWRKGESLPSTEEQGIILGSTGGKNNVTALVDTDDVHCLMIGASGVGKTAFFLYPNLEYACASGSIRRGKNDPSQSLQMMERPLMTADELKSIPKGNFVVMKTGTHPMKTRLHLFLDWGIHFGTPYTVEDKVHRKVVYADKNTLEENIVRKHMACLMVEEETGEIVEQPAGTGTLHTPAVEHAENTMRRRNILKT